MKPTAPISVFSAVTIALAPIALDAAVTLNDSYFTGGNSTDAPALVSEGGGVFSYTYTSLGSFSAAGSDKLVLAFQNKDEGNALTGPEITSVAYNNVGMDQAIQVASGRQRNSVFYLDNTASDGSLVVTFLDGTGTSSDQGQWILGLYALNGTAIGFGDTASGTHPGTDLSSGGPTVTTTTSSAFVLNMWARNNGDLNLTGSVSSFTEDWDTNITDPTGLSSDGDLASVIASTIGATPGEYSTTVSGVGGSVPQTTMVGVVFEAVPEPSSTALLGLGGLALILRRRRS